MNQRTTWVGWVGYAVCALAILATVAFVPTDAAARAQGPPRRVRCCIPQENGGGLECGQLTQHHCAKVGGTSLVPGSCAHNPCGSSTSTTITTRPPTTTTSTSSTTTTTLGPLSLKYTTAAGTTVCGGVAFSSPASPPFSGEIDSDTACSVLIDHLGSACLYFGGGASNGAYPPGATPTGASFYLDIDPVIPGKLNASNGTGMLDCTKGSSTTANYCVNVRTACTTSADCTTNACCTTTGSTLAPGQACTSGFSCTCTSGFCTKACTTDADCGGIGGGGPGFLCQPVENCFFGPPLAIQNPQIHSLATCVINVIATDASGTGDPSTGAVSVDIPLVSLVYLTGNEAAPCPQCACGTPPCSGSGATGCNAGPNVGKACSTTATTGNPATSNTSQDCPPDEGPRPFNGALSVDLTLTTGSRSVTAADGLFCFQTTAGAFGQPGTRCITETGSPAGNLTDGMPHAAVEATVFCIPGTSNGTVNLVADLPGPGATSLPGEAQIVPTP